MTKKMLIDAAHPEETRVVVLDGSKIEDFDFESRGKKQLRGNIYLAKVARVEPSLQAAFVEYGGNRHGFLSFDEIHPDYYQIPAADREALMAEDAAAEAEHRARRSSSPRPARAAVEHSEDGEGVEADDAHDDDSEDELEEETQRRRARLMRRYKIQEVIKRRQIMLVQVVKDERGAKGAALTTYLSLAGRYGVLMPNTGRGGGISRKITAAADRKRLKSIVQGLDVPDGMGLIIRTAGAKRTKAEIKRDYDYLLRLWENIRDTTMKSIAPAAIHEEDDLVKRAIRDMYDKEIEGIWVEGEQGFREARDFMRMLMPSQAKKVLPHQGSPLFVQHGVEAQLSQIYSPNVPLKSGGYLVINQTEALVAIDVNSGKSTRERNIESTALKTNLEAAAEAARQLRLRDLAGLIVIDFIDMDESKHNRAVEKVVKDALAFDRARVQMGKISGFGLMEISRQRRRTGVLEGTTHVCEHCQGLGRVRSTDSSALGALRAVEVEALKGSGEIVLKVPVDVALYILNHKRDHLARQQFQQGLFVEVRPEMGIALAEHVIERITTGELLHIIPAPLLAPPPELDADDLAEIDDEEDVEENEGGAAPDHFHPRHEPDGGEDDRRGRGRRRRRRGGRSEGERSEGGHSDVAVVAAPVPAPRDSEDEGGEDALGRRRRRGRRGGRRAREDERPTDGFVWNRPRVPFDDPFQWHSPAALEVRHAPEATSESSAPIAQTEPAPPRPEREERPREDRRGRGRGGRPAVQAPSDEIWVELPADQAQPSAAPEASQPEAAATDTPAAKPRRGRAKAKAEAAPEVEVQVQVQPSPVAADEPPIEPIVEAVATPAKKPARSRAKAKPVEAAAEMVSAAEAPTPVAPEPVPVVEPVPVEPDPHQITAPPEKPKRGWWRRG
ncbi:MAG: ribonuclease [Caulobacteraceae bacterium]|nr:ribonuclease [Caulobacteraceae bacterium]